MLNKKKVTLEIYYADAIDKATNIEIKVQDQLKHHVTLFMVWFRYSSRPITIMFILCPSWQVKSLNSTWKFQKPEKCSARFHYSFIAFFNSKHVVHFRYCKRASWPSRHDLWHWLHFQRLFWCHWVLSWHQKNILKSDAVHLHGDTHNQLYWLVLIGFQISQSESRGIKYWNNDIKSSLAILPISCTIHYLNFQGWD